MLDTRPGASGYSARFMGTRPGNFIFTEAGGEDMSSEKAASFCFTYPFGILIEYMIAANVSRCLSKFDPFVDTIMFNC